ncbi:hypothetical protein CRENBAI_006919 [Crenichthys baileyi]|uniref:Uncharacterized protein n=1 Tax=Crenichthys baileyi TaxID=28760 RepID=A0AAV9S176_9TELE
METEVANISMTPSLARCMTKAALKSDVNNSTLFIVQPVQDSTLRWSGVVIGDMCFSQTAGDQFLLTAKVHPAEVPFSKIWNFFQLQGYRSEADFTCVQVDVPV